MKKFALILAFLMLFSTLVFSSSAATAYDYEQGKTVVKTFPTVWLMHFEPTDITGAVAIQFDFFVDEADNFRLNALEFGSHRNNDWQEIQYTGVGKWPKLNDGWNTVRFELSAGIPVADVDAHDGTSGEFDPTTFQRIRMFNITNSDPSVTYGIKNIVALKADGSFIRVGGGDDDTPITPIELDPIINVTVQPGSDDTSLNFNFIANHKPQGEPYVEIAPIGADFENAKTVFKGNYVSAGVAGVSGNDILARYGCRMTATNLKPASGYAYRVGYDDYESEIFTIYTSSSRSTSAYVLSDIHVLDLWNLQQSIDNWEITLGQLTERDEASLVLSLGDQMQDTTKQNFLDGFFGIEGLTGVALAPINGNHDLSPAGGHLKEYTNVPNQTYPKSSGISDYYFKSGNTLFIMLSLTDINYQEVDHEKTFKEAIAAYPDYDWMVVGMHEAIYGYYLKGFSANDGDALDYCNEFYGKFIRLIDKYSPDVCLTGHSHSYMRSYFMKDGEVQDVVTRDDGTFVSPGGTVYINMGTSSRQSQFGGQDPTPNWPWSYSAFSIHGHASYTYGLLETNGGRLTMEVRDNLHPDQVIDSIAIEKELKPKPEKPTETETEQANETVAESSTETTQTQPEKKGCGAVMVGSSMMCMVALMGAAGIFTRRKED